MRQLAAPDAAFAAAAVPTAGSPTATPPSQATAQPLQPVAPVAAGKAPSTSVGSGTPPDHVTQQGEAGTGNCRPTAEEMAHGAQGTTNRGTAFVDSLAQSDNVMASQAVSDQALTELEGQIQDHDRAVVGVNRVGDARTPNAEFGDEVTNHLVTAYRVERHPNGGVTICYSDPGTVHADQSLGTLHRPPGGTMFRAQRPWVGIGGTQPDYQKTTVRERGASG